MLTPGPLPLASSPSSRLALLVKLTKTGGGLWHLVNGDIDAVSTVGAAGTVGAMDIPDTAVEAENERADRPSPADGVDP